MTDDIGRETLKGLSYANGLIAEYMHQEFGVKYLNLHGSRHTLGVFYHFEISFGAPPLGDNDKFPLDYPNTKISKDWPILIHPDSYHIFEPRDGDKDEDGMVYEDKHEGWESPPYYCETFGESLTAKPKQESQTARRDGKEFFWPRVWL